jgi:hypothetical protein
MLRTGMEQHSPERPGPSDVTAKVAITQPWLYRMTVAPSPGRPDDVPVIGVRRHCPVLAIVSGCPKASLGCSAYVPGGNVTAGRTELAALASKGLDGLAL